VRLSSDDRRKKGDSIATQKNIISHFITMNPDIKLHDFYVDNDKTGTNFERPAFQKMLADMENGKINCVIVKDLSRFGRNAIDTGYYIEKYLPSLNVRFISINDSFDTDESDGAGNPCGGIVLPLKAVIAEAYALDLGNKVRSVHGQNIKEGRYVGGRSPYGYLKSPDDCHKLMIDPETAPVVRQIFDWAAQGVNHIEIARRLNDTHITPPSLYKYKGA
jgi:DNA invertase Pin-like site-specific DNA recombinase